MSALLEVDRIDTGYESMQVVDQVSLALQPGEIGCILGPSGCGKTTVLRAIAGFEALWSGSIRIDEIEVSSATFCQVPEKRNIGMVFQDFALFPHLRVEDNLRFGLQGLDKKAQQTRIGEMLAIVGMPAFA